MRPLERVSVNRSDCSQHGRTRRAARHSWMTTTLGKRVRHVILFGTPSGGLRKAGWVPFWKRQLQNMTDGSPFILELRQAWKQRYGAASPFDFLVVAGASDQFVPPRRLSRRSTPDASDVVPGDHVSIVKPANADAPSLSLVVATLGAGKAPARDPIDGPGWRRSFLTRDASELVQKVKARARDVRKDEVNAAWPLSSGESLLYRSSYSSDTRIRIPTSREAWVAASSVSGWSPRRKSTASAPSRCTRRHSTLPRLPTRFSISPSTWRS